MKCPICEFEVSKEYKYIPTTMHKLIDFDTKSIMFCNNCIYGFSIPFKQEDLDLYYSKYYSGKLYKHRNKIKTKEKYTKFTQDLRSLSQINLLSNFINFNLNLNILEIGSSTNNFIFSLYHINKNSKFFSSDYNTLDNHISIKKIELISPEIANKYKEKFDLISMSHTLEHFQGYEISKTISLIRQMLKKNGLLFIEVPNADIEKFEHERIVPHTSFFSISSFKKIATNMDFKVIFLNTCGDIQITNDQYLKLKNFNIKSNNYHFIESKEHKNIKLNLKLLKKEEEGIKFTQTLRFLLKIYIPFYNDLKLMIQKILFKNTLGTYLNNKKFVYGKNREYIRVIFKK